VASSRYYPGSCLEGLRNTTTDLGIAGVPVEIRAENLPNTNHDFPQTLQADAEVMPYRGPRPSSTIFAIRNSVLLCKSMIPLSFRVLLRNIVYDVETQLHLLRFSLRS
jgi:hypothetical protein